MKKKLSIILGCVAALAAASSLSLSAPGCGNPTTEDTPDMTVARQSPDLLVAALPDLAGSDMTGNTPSPDMTPADCVSMLNANSPHVDIINACTTADRVAKVPNSPKYKEGQPLPPLP